MNPPFDTFRLVQLPDVASASRFVDSLAVTEPDSTIVAANLVSKKSERRLRYFQAFLRRLPQPSTTGGSLPPSHRGPLVPSDEQLSALTTLSEDEPVLTLSLNRYKDQAVDPLTGEQKSGREVFQVYFRRSLTTFSRVGAEVLWRGRVRGVVAGDLDMPQWHEAWAVSYPSFRAFNRMFQNARYRSKVGHRIAGLESSWIVMGQIAASSESTGDR